MKVLLITTETEDYLQDSIIHGFKMLLGVEACDYPAKQMLYKDYKNLSTIRGNGFTLYGLLDPNIKFNQNVSLKNLIAENDFDKIIFTSIHRQYKEFYSLYPLLKYKKNNVWLIDGEDDEVIFPYLLRYLSTWNFWFKTKPHKKFRYFKREFTPNSTKFFFKRFFLAAFMTGKKYMILPVSFSIPEEKIVKKLFNKTKLFSSHIVDDEVATNMLLNNKNYLFHEESQYYNDLQNSKFGITTKRAGWDCLRHYEIAANGTVICFRNLHLKPSTCAPHGLIDGHNCLSYINYDDLITKISLINEDEYNKILTRSLEWIKSYTTVELVKRMLLFDRA